MPVTAPPPPAPRGALSVTPNLSVLPEVSELGWLPPSDRWHDLPGTFGLWVGGGFCVPRTRKRKVEREQWCV